MSRRIPYPRLLLFWLFLIAAQGARAQDVQPPPHPNSYIVLVDASGSTERSAGQRRIYEQVLRERLVPALYQTGFGAVPPYDPRQDELTLYHFGVVTGDAATAYRRLAASDLLSDLTHPEFIREKGVDAERLKVSITPAQTYQYTLLSWVKQLALERSRPERPGEVRQHTFIIMIHDGLPNENSAQGEIDMLRRWAGPNYERYGKVVEAIDRDYRFTDGGGAPAYAEEIKGDAVGEGWSFFIEAYEVTSKAEAEWEERGRRLRPLDGLSLRWVDTSGETPRGLLVGTPSEEFKQWADSASSREVSLAADPDGRSGAGMEVPVTLRHPLTCDPLSLNTSLRATLRRSDSLLGDRTINYTHAQAVEAPPPFRCTAFSTAFNSGLALLAAAALLGIVYFFRYRFRATHLRLLIPGTMTPIRLARAGRREGFASVVPQAGLEALSVEVPGRLRRWFFYRRATITLTSADGAQLLGWFGEDGSAELKLSLARGCAPAYWRLLPGSSSEITVTFRQGKQTSALTLFYPRALTGAPTRSPFMHPDRHDDIVYVSLDLGSESMAAYYEDMHGRHGMIQLQEYAGELMKTNGGGDTTLALLQEADGKASPRLWNRISFKINSKQPAEPGPEHAQLCFVVSPKAKKGERVSVELYEESLFNFFHPLGGWPPSPTLVMPNPKILFQQQVTDVLDELRVPARDGERVSLLPQMLINHLTLQVVINFVLNSAELSRYRREDVHLTITVPNVYSLPHAESIKEFVRTNVGPLADVEVLSESDAVAYYALRAIDRENDPPELIRFKEAWTKQLELSKDVCFVTIDVGKGTTDLSCILVQNPPAQTWRPWGQSEEEKSLGKRRRHSVQGKTGKSSGGTYLNYILASYYDARLKEVVAASPPGMFTNEPFGFIVKDVSQLQQSALLELENLIEHVKRSMTEDYEIDEALLSLGEQREMAAKVVDYIIRGVANLSGLEEIPARYGDFRARAIDALLLPSRLAEPEEPTSVQQVFSGLRRITAPLRGLLAHIRGSAPKPAAAATAEFPAALAPANGDGVAPALTATPHTEKLRRDIEGYVAENVDELLDSLKNLVSDHQAVVDKGKSGIDGAAFVIISGQASQFRPLRAAIMRKCGTLRIEGEHILAMTGVSAKEACCKGVVNFWVDGMETTNPKELHGTYGCLDRATGNFKPFDMRKVKSERKDTITFDVESAYWIVFTPRACGETEERRPQLNDGATARLRLFRNQSRFELKYDPDRLELTVNGERLTISSFGSPDGSIYKKVWPEILQPHN